VTPVTPGFEVASVGVADTGYMLHAGHVFYAHRHEVVDFFGIVTPAARPTLVARVLGRAFQLGKDPDETIFHAGPVTKVVRNEDSSFTRALTTNYAVEVLPGSMVIEADAVLETSLYEPATGDKLVYQATTRGHFELGAHYPVEEVAQRFALSLAKRLSSDQVIH
jgi:hypothetical protein